jgi:hypothetical protein
MGSVEPRHLGVASGLNSTMRTLGMLSSMTIITVIFSVFMGSHAVTAAQHVTDRCPRWCPEALAEIRAGRVNITHALLQ